MYFRLYNLSPCQKMQGLRACSPNTAWSQSCQSLYSPVTSLLSRQQTSRAPSWVHWFSNGGPKITLISPEVVERGNSQSIGTEKVTQKIPKPFNEVSRRHWSSFWVAYSQWPALVATRVTSTEVIEARVHHARERLA